MSPHGRDCPMRLVLAGVLLVGLATPVARAEGVFLVPRFQLGESVRYRMQLSLETESTLNPLGQALTGEGAVRLVIDMTWQLEALEVEPTGAVKLRAIIEALEVQSSASLASPPLQADLVGLSITYRLLPDGSVDSVEAPEDLLQNGQPPAWLRTWLEQASGPPPGWPQGPVEPGDQWRAEQEFEVPGLPRQHLTSESEYLRDEQVSGRPCASILTRFELVGADRHEPASLAGTKAGIERSVEGGGSRLSCYEHSTGRLLQSTQKSRETIRLEVRHRSGKPTDTTMPTVVESRTITESHLHVVD